MHYDMVKIVLHALWYGENSSIMHHDMVKIVHMHFYMVKIVLHALWYGESSSKCTLIQWK